MPETKLCIDCKHYKGWDVCAYHSHKSPVTGYITHDSATVMREWSARKSANAPRYYCFDAKFFEPKPPAKSPWKWLKEKLKSLGKVATA